MPAAGTERVPVLLCTQQQGPGGTERQLAATALALDRKRFAVHTACFIPGFRSDELRAHGIPVLDLPVRSFVSTNAAAAALKLTRYLRQHRIRLVHSFDYPMNVFAVPVARFARVPIVLSSQRGHRELVPPMYRRLLRASDRLVDGVVVNCEAMRKHLEEEERVARSRISVCYNGIDTSFFRPGPRVRQAALASARLVVGVVCVLRPEKDVATLIRAFPAVAAKHAGCMLAIVGSGPELETLQKLAEELGVAPQVHFEPATRDVPAWLHSMDIFVLPSLSEALSNSLMEAMACGCVPVASDTGGNPELVRHEGNGLTFPAADSTTLATHLDRLLGDEGLRQRYVEQSVRLIEKQFSLATAGVRMAEIYESYLQR